MSITDFFQKHDIIFTHHKLLNDSVNITNILYFFMYKDLFISCGKSSVKKTMCCAKYYILIIYHPTDVK